MSHETFIQERKSRFLGVTLAQRMIDPPPGSTQSTNQQVDRTCIFRRTYFHVVPVHLVVIQLSVGILLVLADQIGQVGLGLGEFEFIHSLASVPVQET